MCGWTNPEAKPPPDQRPADGGVDHRPGRVGGALEAPPFVAGDPVHEGGPGVRPPGRRFFVKALVPRRRAEEVHLLARGAYAVADDVGKEPAEPGAAGEDRSEEHTSELQSQSNLVCRLLLEKKKKKRQRQHMS